MSGPKREEFEQELFGCVDRALRWVGDDIPPIIYWDAKRRTGLSAEQIGENPEQVIRSIRNIFGSGAVVLEAHIIREIQLKFDLPLDPRCTLESAIKDAKNASMVNEIMGQ